MDFSGKVVVLTGASSGIGASTAVYLAKLNAKLTLVGRNVANLKKVRSECEKYTDTLSVVADLTKGADIENIIRTTIDRYGQIDVLVNNAGILEMGTIENTSLEQCDRIMNTNVRSIYHLTMLATPHIVKTKGNIVTVSSVNGLRSFPGVLAYNVSKAAVDQFTRCVSLELAPKGVRVNNVNPGVVVSELQKRGGLSEEQYEAFLVRSKETHALGRPGQPDEVAAAIAFLASDLASNITGVSLPVDGGRHAMCPR
ncbi:3-oxoacyl-[acyl-carrier-protein] reductase FabG-like [Achroia grisella]|uniref:3-oxoacyl-[acyl-carrier-protein] reductase FabG-like n=1 Tax=Achroia grisella TaxID=688607 RepID=UPI0027D2603B|nr:3-oxoacyl-[acyl-carrier-protein] reductase FabG-like [Achroia grisella]